VSDAAALRTFLAARDDAEHGVAPGMGSRLFEGWNDQAIVLLHGLTASPPAWEAIATDLHATGAMVVLVRLPLHGHADRMSTALEGLSVDLLTEDLQSVVAAVAALGKRVVIGGHSLGGTLAIHAAATVPAVERIVAIAPFLGIAGMPHELHPVLVPLIRSLPNVFVWWDPVDRERQEPLHGYPRYPLHALAVGMGIADNVYDDALRPPQARAIDLVINTRETSVSNRTVHRLVDRWRTAGAAIGIHQLDGLPPSHDIIEPHRPNSLRVRATLVRLLLGERSDARLTRHLI
jgi:pimeloyl-ACP methyl ester carboxylesterase